MTTLPCSLTGAPLPTADPSPGHACRTAAAASDGPTNPSPRLGARREVEPVSEVLLL